jgi:hypothetical protein
VAHALNRVMVAFMGPFEDAIGLSSMLTTIRSFVNAGGQVSRKAALLEYGLSLSRLDLTTTRWSSLMLCVNNLCGLQSPTELERAEKRLRKKSAQGDANAAEALEEASVSRCRWDVLYEAIESIDVGKLDGECRGDLVGAAVS